MGENDNNALEDQLEDAVLESADGEAEEAEKPKKKKKKTGLIVLVVILAVVVAGGVGVYVWHEQPSFCGAICHQPMDEYLATFELEPGASGVDKWGNEVTNSNSMMAVVHKTEGEDCLGCHVPSIGEQVTEGITWVTGNYEDPLSERTVADLCEARGIEEAAFCLNDSCHHVAADESAITSEDELIVATSDRTKNPHNPGNGVVAHPDFACGDCHKAHRASVNQCTTCHNDAEIPEGWLDKQQERALATTYVVPAA